MNRPENLVLLDCTIRDGNYAIDFKFTEADTALLVGQLSRLGFTWIEVGHGVGLGGAAAGKGVMPASDEKLIEAAKSSGGGAKIGTFFIPGIGKMEHLEAARDAGLDFVRIGDNAPEIARTFPFVRRARELGLIPCVNMMKSYALTPEQFAEKTKEAADAGAEVVYCVDSAGSMLPDDVARYFDAARNLTNCDLGFHGHNNLMMVIANCLTAYDHGVRFLDVTLCGFGRSAGNAPTEILVAVLERYGVATGLDLFAIMDTIDQYVWPLVGQMRAHDMMAVAGGYSQFHSSFLPPIAAAARKHHAELRRLVVKVARHDPVSLDEQYLEQAAQELQDTQRINRSTALSAFNVSAISHNRISNTVESVKALLDGLVVASAKRPGTKTLLHLVATKNRVKGLVMPEFLLSDSQAIMGRVSFGTEEVLRQVVELAKPHVSNYLVSQNGGWSSGALDIVNSLVGAGRAFPVRDREVIKAFLQETLDYAAIHFGREALFVYGPNDLLWDVLQSGTQFDSVFVYGGSAPPAGLDRVIVVNNLSDWKNLKLQFNVIVCSMAPLESEARALATCLAPSGRILSVASGPGALPDIAGDRLIEVDLRQAYAGVPSKYIAVTNALNCAKSVMVPNVGS